MEPVKIPRRAKTGKSFIELEGPDHLGSVQVDVSVFVCQSDAIGQRKVLENLLCVSLPRVSSCLEAPDQRRIVQSLGRLKDVIPTIRHREPLFPQ